MRDTNTQRAKMNWPLSACIARHIVIVLDYIIVYWSVHNLYLFYCAQNCLLMLMLPQVKNGECKKEQFNNSIANVAKCTLNVSWKCRKTVHYEWGFVGPSWFLYTHEKQTLSAQMNPHKLFEHHTGAPMPYEWLISSVGAHLYFGQDWIANLGSNEQPYLTKSLLNWNQYQVYRVRVYRQFASA